MDDTRASELGRLRDCGQHQTWEDFYTRFQPLIHGLALSSGLARSEAEDATQETFIAIARQMPEFQYDLSKGRFRNWIYNIARRRIADQWRKLNRTVGSPPMQHRADGTSFIEEIAGPAPDPGADNVAPWNKALAIFAYARVQDRVSAKNFQIFDQRVFKGLTVEVLARAFSMSKARVYWTTHRVGRFLKKEIQSLQKQGWQAEN